MLMSYGRSTNAEAVQVKLERMAAPALAGSPLQRQTQHIRVHFYSLPFRTTYPHTSNKAIDHKEQRQHHQAWV